MSEAPIAASPLDVGVRAQFEAWAQEQWGGNASRHTSNCCGEWEAWRAATERCIGIIEAYHVPVGNSSAGELACEWTMDALREIRDAMRSNV